MLIKDGQVNAFGYNGVIDFEDASKFEGQWINDQIQGFGRYITKDGN